MGWEKGGTVDIRWLGKASLLNNKSYVGRKEVRQADLRKNSVWGERKTSRRSEQPRGQGGCGRGQSKGPGLG